MISERCHEPSRLGVDWQRFPSSTVSTGQVFLLVIQHLVVVPHPPRGNV